MGVEDRTALIAFAKWLLKDEHGEGREIELVDQFLQETCYTWRRYPQ